MALHMDEQCKVRLLLLLLWLVLLTIASLLYEFALGHDAHRNLSQIIRRSPITTLHSFMLRSARQPASN